MRTSVGVLAAMIILGGVVLSPRTVAAQGACEAVGAMAPAIAGAQAVGGVGHSISGLIDRTSAAVDQAASGNGPAQGDDASATPVPPPPSPSDDQPNVPGPAVAGC